MSSSAQRRHAAFAAARSRMRVEFRAAFNELARRVTRYERLLAAHLVSGSPPGRAIVRFLDPRPTTRKPKRK
jgi:hypothetical protein